MSERPDIEALASIAVDCGLKLHQRLGPGLLESAYEKVLAHMLMERGLRVETQKLVPITVDGLCIENGFRADILVEGQLLIEVKSVDRFEPVHAKQVLTYLRLLDMPLGLLMNFSCATFRERLRRVVNNHQEIGGSPLNIHQ